MSEMHSINGKDIFMSRSEAIALCLWPTEENSAVLSVLLPEQVDIHWTNQNTPMMEITLKVQDLTEMSAWWQEREDSHD